MPEPSPLPPRRILHVDADAFFVQVARRADPDGAGRAPLLIVGGRPGSRGVVCSASYECRAYGVRSAMPIARALRLCPTALCVPVPRVACSAASRAIARVLADFTPVVQSSSIDEWYLDLGGTEALYRGESLEQTAARIRTAVIAATGFTVSIGGGTTRLVAKLAVERAKPKPGSGANGVHVVPAGEEVAFLGTLAVADLPMVGPRFQQQLALRGLERVAAVQQLSRASLVQMLGPRAGEWLADRVQGIDASAVDARGEAKQISREDTFEQDLHEDEAIARELLRLSVKVAADLRRSARVARTITIKLRDSDFVTRTARRTLDDPIRTDRAMARVATELLARLRRTRQVGVRLLGVAASHFEESVDLGPRQLELFGAVPPVDGPPVSQEEPRDHALADAVDRIRARFGDRAIVPAALVDTERPSDGLPEAGDASALRPERPHRRPR
jgi:DNA polymerase IV